MDRRGLLKGSWQILALGCAKPALAGIGIGDRPERGDILVHAETPNEGKILTAAELKPGAAPVVAWAMSPETRRIKRASRLGEILVLKLDDAAGTIRAFSAVCTHAGCFVTGWKPESHHLLCPCHGSEYDPARDGAVVFGPAPAPLPSLTVASRGDVLTVTEPFRQRLGGSTSRSD